MGQELAQGWGPVEGELPANSSKRAECLYVFLHLKKNCVF